MQSDARVDGNAVTLQVQYDKIIQKMRSHFVFIMSFKVVIASKIKKQHEVLKT